MNETRSMPDWLARPQAVAPELVGRYVHVRRFDPMRHGPSLWQAFPDPDATFYYFSWPPMAKSAEFAELIAEKNASGHMSTALLEVDGAPLGMASFMRRDPSNGSVEVGAIAHAPRLAGTTAATEAHYLLARHVFETLGYRRYEWKCDSHNEASKRSAKRLGFTYEGTFRQHAVVKGRNRDTAWFSMIDGEWPRLAEAFRAWLEPRNFDGEGRQRRSLEDIRALL